MRTKGSLSVVLMVVPVLVMAALLCAYSRPMSSGGGTLSSAKMLLDDEFNMAGAPKQTRWVVVRGNPKSSKGMMTLAGAEIQSKDLFTFGEMRIALESSEWIPHTVFTDSSFGFEFWGGKNGKCHFAVLFKPSGHLALLNANPDQSDECFGDPVPGEEQAYVEVSGWDQLRMARRLEVTLSWRSEVVTVTVSDGAGHKGEASYSGPVLPKIPLRARLYTHTFDDGRKDTFAMDYVRIGE